MERQLFLGVDGGGSKTTAVVFDETGNFVCSYVGESINYYSIGLDSARANMAQIVAEIGKTAGCESFRGAVIGMSALGEKATDEELEAFASGVIEADSIYMDSDLYIAMQALNARNECAVVISGTGSMVTARKADGEMIHAGGWGHILGDEGSGYCIGLDAIKAAIASYEGYGEKTELYEECLSFFEIDNIYDLIGLFYDKGVSRKKVAAFAVNVRVLAATDDKVSYEILESGAKKLSKTVLSLIKDFPKELPIGLWGGIFQHSQLYTGIFTQELEKEGFENVKLLSFTPEIGAVFAAYRFAGVEINEAVLENITNSYLRKGRE